MTCAGLANLCFRLGSNEKLMRFLYLRHKGGFFAVVHSLQDELIFISVTVDYGQKTAIG